MSQVKTNKAVLFLNPKQGRERRPDYTGIANVEGKELNLAAWKRIDKNGREYLSLTFTEPDENETERTNTNGNA